MRFDVTDGDDQADVELTALSALSVLSFQRDRAGPTLPAARARPIDIRKRQCRAAARALGKTGSMATASDAIRLRPVRESDLEVLERVDTDATLSEPFEWRGFADARARRQRWEQDGYLGPTDSLLVIALSDDTFIGLVTWRSSWAFGPQGCVDIGILLLPDHRGQGYGTTAHHLLVDYLFETTTVYRIQATTEVDNDAEQRALEKAGFTREGVLRGGSFVRGQWRDYALYGRLRTDPSPVP